MRAFQIWWLKISCFLTGYNYYILSNCSEVSIRKVKKYTAALLIISVVWSFVGFCFCSRYIKLGVSGSILGSIISVLIILQIERQILLIDKTNNILKATRIGLAILMAIIGSLIIDQLIFKDDIDKTKIAINQQKVNSLMSTKTKEITNQISAFNDAIRMKENERKILIEDINKNPNISIIETSSNMIPVTKQTTDSLKRSTTNTVLKRTTSTNVRVIPNPKTQQLPEIYNQLKELNVQKGSKETMLLNVKANLEKEVQSKVGFLDELTIMFSIIRNSIIAGVVYLIWFIFLLLLELLVLIGKSNDSESDYDKTIQKQMEIHLRKIQLL
ncbi:DUF4407 domain-containing protein [Pedobacter paludis]|uniref:DUF4407 domain-containing protein n=1 Tax=Pedobacter paludis TaxID=2203212 RepID=A0A317F1A2_9SPHI|nr:DUF4407 domain-containing protein [Pedobacter paludis]PWS32535.1 DUF4407 domain-containing protein [Pedobacter paludis]